MKTWHVLLLAMSFILMINGCFATINHAVLNAVQKGDLNDVISVISRDRTKVNERDKDGYTPLHEAVYNGHLEIAKYLISQGADVNAKDDNGDISLHEAVFTHNLEIVKYLISKGANVNTENNSFGQTPLHRACYGDNIEIVKYLISQGSDVDAKDKNGNTPLLLAAGSGHTSVVKTLTDAGANVNDKNEFGVTVLMKAAEYGSSEIVEMLIKRGADIDIIDNTGRTPLLCSMEARTTMGVQSIVKALISAGADVNVKGNNGVTPLMMIMKNIFIEKAHIMDVLISAGADVNAKDNDGNTTLMYAYQYPVMLNIYLPRLKNIQTLIVAGADVNGRNNKGETLLIRLSASQIDLSCHLKMLIESGADVEARDNNRNTPLILTETFGIQENIRVIKNALPSVFSLSITSTPIKAEVSIDKRYIGKTPLTIDDIKKGQHIVLIRKDNYKDCEESILVNENKRINIELIKSSYTISIYSTPSGAGVYFNGSYKGNTPINVEVIKGSSYDIKLEKDGYQNFIDRFSAYNDKTFHYRLNKKEIIDNEPPGIVISSPINKLKTINEKILLKGEITDNIKLKEIEMRLNNENVHHQEITGPSFILSREVILNKGRNDIIIEAVDQAGNKDQKSITIYLIEPVVEERAAKIEKLVTIPKLGNYYAVIIGIGKYQDDKIPELKYTTVDAQSIYNILIDPQYGNFHKDQVKLLIDENATYYNIKSAIGTWLKRNTQKDDTVIIFYAGHGAPEDEKTYWVTYNANIDDLYGTALSNDELSDMFDRIEAKTMIAFLDSCYSAATINRTDKKRGIIVGDPFQKFKGKGRVIITSSDGKEQSLEIEKFGHGIFTYYLLNALKGEADDNKDGFVELDEVWNYVKYRVSDTARKHGSSQTPMLDGAYSAGILLSKSPERLKSIYLEAEKEKKEKELETKISKLTKLYSKGEMTSSQFDKAVRILESGKRNKLLDDFLSDKISLTTFRRVFK